MEGHPETASWRQMAKPSHDNPGFDPFGQFVCDFRKHPPENRDWRVERRSCQSRATPPPAESISTPSITIWVYDSVGFKYAFGTVTSVDVVDASEALSRVLRNKAIAERILRQARAKLARVKAKAKKKGVPFRAYRPYKKADKKYKRARAAAKSLGLNPVA